MKPTTSEPKRSTPAIQILILPELITIFTSLSRAEDIDTRLMDELNQSAVELARTA